MQVEPKLSPNVSAIGRNIVQLQQMQSAAARQLVADLEREPPPSAASTIVSLSAESVKLSQKG
jgi:hypothetical protein